MVGKLRTSRTSDPTEDLRSVGGYGGFLRSVGGYGGFLRTRCTEGLYGDWVNGDGAMLHLISYYVFRYKFMAIHCKLMIMVNYINKLHFYLTLIQIFVMLVT